MNPINTPPLPPGAPHSRKIHYIDHVLQKRMLIALVVLEVIVLSAAGSILYWRLSQIVDDSVYRIHFDGQPSMFSILLKESLWVLAGLVAANVLALFVADRIWVRYVRSIVIVLRDLLTQSRDLDFRDDADMLQRHKVVSLALGWRSQERARLQRLQRAMETAAAQPLANNDEFRASLLALRGHLPRSSAVQGTDRA